MKSAWLATDDGGWVNVAHVVRLTPSRPGYATVAEAQAAPMVWHVEAVLGPLASTHGGHSVRLAEKFASHEEASDAISRLLDDIL